MSYKVVGLRVEKYMGESVSGHNCDFEYTPQIMERHILLLKGYENVELTLETSEGECGSGWCSASFGNFTWKEVNTFAEKTHTPKEPLTIDLEESYLLNLEEEATFKCDVFEFSPVGGDYYYPSGNYEVNMELFQPVGVQENKRPVHIFYGDSNLCKSHIAALTGKSIFETDSVSDLPETINADVIVLGNKCKMWTVEDIKSRIMFPEDSKIITVEFKETPCTQS